MLQEFSVTTIEALITYLTFLPDLDYEVIMYQVATEPHVKNLVDFLKNLGADIEWGIDHTLRIKPVAQMKIKEKEFTVISDYIEAGTFFAIGAGADNTQLTIKNFHVDDLSAMYNLADKIGINFRILDKQTLKVDSYNKANYRATKMQTLIFPGFPTDLQSVFATLLTQAHGVSKIYETLFEGRFGYLNQLENLGAKVEILNPHQAWILGPTKLKGGYVSSTDLRGGSAMILAGIMAEGTTAITNESIIERGYDHIVQKLQKIGVQIQQEGRDE